MVTFPILLRPLSIIACLFRSLLLVLFAGPVSAEQPFSFATTPGQLPKTVMPVLYALDLTPDLDKLSFTGTEIVDIDVAAPATNRLVLNAVDITIEKASIDGDTLPSTALILDPAAETLTLSRSHPIPSVGTSFPLIMWAALIGSAVAASWSIIRPPRAAGG